jgi:type I restriction enzyme S subunit
LISLTGTAGKEDYGNVCILHSKTYNQYLLNQRVAKLITKKQLNSIYLFYLLKENSFKAQLIGFNRGVRQGNISNQDIKNLIIPLPPLPLQQKFASIVEHIEKLKEKQQKSKEEIDNLFNSLMQKAFNGELVR